MSYARIGANGSDVYVFMSSAGLECCGCGLDGEMTFYISPNNAGMIEHMERHIAAGHTVPESCMERLRDPTDAADNAYYMKHQRWPEEG